MLNQHIKILVRYLVTQLCYEQNTLCKYYYAPTIFKNFVSNFDPQLDSYLNSQNKSYFEYSENFGVFFEEHGKDEVIPSLENFRKVCQVPLPDWAKELQYHLLDHIYTESNDGWSLDLFYSYGKNMSLGSHIDNDDVYTVQLYGVKQWIVDLPDLYRLRQLINDDRVKRLSSSETWVNNNQRELEFNNPVTITMSPGDFLALPAFALHRVTTLTDGCNFSFNVGIRQEHSFTSSMLFHM